MLVPAILYKEEIQSKFKEKYYSEDMFYETGCLQNWLPNIKEEPEDGDFQFAIINADKKLIGFLSYRVNWYSSAAYNFGLISFDRGNPILGKDLFAKMEELVQRFHRVEWRMIGGNPVEKHYDAFCNKHNGKKFVLTDAVRDKDGNYRNDVIYEIVHSNQ